MSSIVTTVREFLPFTRPMPLSAETSLLALRIAQEYRFSWFDSLIVASALENNCSILVSEDLHHGQVIEKNLTIINPINELYDFFSSYTNPQHAEITVTLSVS
jgi:predicted nucleic acid-binding protein